MARLLPQTFHAMIALGETVHDFDPVLSELVRTRASQMNGCAFCIDMHTKDARAAGESEQRLYALNAWRETPFFTPRERAALALTEAMTFPFDGHVSDDVYEEATRYFEPKELAKLIMQITIINSWNRIAITTRTVPGSYQVRAH
ncbi:MAG: carboxymuconolactone decarboxylase family protein [Chloroflexi bacterium]|nr:carboxymuconolactone decarboxylase family protein [Chloroflexota bacterium]